MIELRHGIDAHVPGCVAYVLSAPDGERRAAALLERSRPDSANASHRDGECERRAMTVHAVAPRTAMPSTSKPNGERSHSDMPQMNGPTPGVDRRVASSGLVGQAISGPG